jgi:2-hydroxy-6-oxonona-2,4-dienedioate hydrolase
MATQPWRSSWVMANGIKTHYSEAGDDGPAVILLHGGGPGSSGAAGWRFMIPALAPHFRVYAPDQVSFGQTDMSDPRAWPSNGIESLVEHVADFIDALCLDTFYVVGNSQGAYVAAKYTLDHPTRVKKLFLIGSATIAGAMGVAPMMTPGMKALIEYDGTEKKMRAFLEAIVTDQNTVTEELVKGRNDAYNLPGVPEATKVFADVRPKLISDPNLNQHYSLEGRLNKLTIPTKFIWGAEDKFAPPELAHQFQDKIPNLPIEFIEGAGHQVQTDKPDVVNKMVIDFFK